MASENQSKQFYCLQSYEGKSVWKTPTLTLLLKTFKISTVVDCRPNPCSINRIFNKKNVRKLCKGTATYFYAKRLAAAESKSLGDGVLSGTFADIRGPILILTTPDKNASRPKEVCNALHESGSISTIHVNGFKVSAEAFIPFPMESETLEEEVQPAKSDRPKRKHNLTGKRVTVNGDRTLGEGSDGVVHSTGLIVTRNDDSEVLAIIRRQDFELAKGRVENNETFAAAAVRELQEESGCLNPEVLKVEWRWAYVCEYPFSRRKTNFHTKKVFWFYASLPRSETLQFGDREKRTKEVKWIKTNDYNRSVDVCDAIFQIQSVLGRYVMHSQKVGFENDEGIQCRKPPRFSLNDTESYLDFLDQHGFVVIANVISGEEIEKGKDMFWEWMEGLGSGIIRDDPNTWIDKNWPSKARFGSGIMHTCGVGQSDLQWFIRTRPSVRKVFEEIWETKELLTSYDGFAGWRPWQYNSTWRTSPSWFHVDQNPATNQGRECFQAQVTLTPSTHETGGFTCIPGSHKCFPEFEEPFQTCNHKIWRLTFKGIKNHRVQKMDKIHVCCEAGDMVIWDSRLMHASTHSFVKPELSSRELLRITSFVCFTPRLPKLSNDLIQRRIAGVDSYATTSHLPYEWHPTEDLESSNRGRSKHGLSQMSLPKRLRELPEEAFPLISGYAPESESAI